MRRGQESRRTRSIFRAANERIDAARRRLELGDRPSPFICECADSRCARIVLVLPEVYGRARADAECFLVAEGHEDRGRIVERRNGYAIVEPGRGGTMDERDERTARIVRNEALFRTVNERVKDVNEAFSVVLERTSFVCECGRRDCIEQIPLALEEYEAVRADPATFAIVPGHELPDVEHVVGRNERYAVVRKHEGLPRELAEDLDPRSD